MFEEEIELMNNLKLLAIVDVIGIIYRYLKNNQLEKI